MNKLNTYIFYFLLISILSFISCEKLDIPNEKTTVEEGGANKGEEPIYVLSVRDIINEQFTKTENVYVVGYIVGYVETTNMDFSCFSRGDVETNILIADTPVDTFANKCIPIQLTTTSIPCKETRTALNLAKNDMLGQKVRLQGDIGYYMGVTGILKARNHILLENDFTEGDDGSDTEKTESETGDDETSGNGNGETGGDDTDDDTYMSDDGDEEQKDDPMTDEEQWMNLVEYIYSHGTENYPFNVMDFKTNLPEFLSHFGAPEIGTPGMKDVYICGYIVGYIPKGNSKMERTIFSNEGATQTNIVLSDSPDEQDYKNCIAVELSLSSNRTKEVREALNLENHPENYKKRFIIYGNIDTYMGILGLKSTREYILCDDE